MRAAADDYKVAITRRFSRTRLLLAWLMALVPRPVSGRLWLDVVYLGIIVALHTTVVPQILHGIVAIDLITPWLTLAFIRQKWLDAMILANLAALSLETHSSVPAGFYFCIYWVAGMVIFALRPQISWRNLSPWTAALVLTQLWSLSFDVLVAVVSDGASQIKPLYLVAQSGRLLTSVGFGLFLVLKVVYPQIRDEELS